MGSAPFPTVSLLNNPNNVNLLPDLNALYPSGPTGSLPSPVSSGSFFNPENVTSSINFPSVTQSDTPDYSSGLPDSILNIPGLQTSIPNTVAGAANSINPCSWYDLVCQFTPAGQVASPTTTANVTSGLGGIGSSISSGLSSAFGSTFAGFSWGRIGAFMLALIMIAAGLYLFGSQSVSQSVGRVVKRGVAI